MGKTKVSIIKCPDYDRSLAIEAVKNALNPLGGIGRFVKPGMTVFVKPNMLSAKEPERGITTHPLILEAIFTLVRKAGGNPVFGDSPAGALKGIKRFWDRTGFMELSDRTGTPLLNFEGGGVISKTIRNRQYHIAKAVGEADVIINVPKFKTHFLTLYTGAVKNMFGSIPGIMKGNYHKQAPKPYAFSKILVDIYEAAKPVLTIMDGITGMEGNGPSSGQFRNTGLLAASADGIALDHVCQSIMGFKNGEIHTNEIASGRELGTSDDHAIEIAGPSIDSIKFHDFILPSNRHLKMIPDFLINALGKLIWVHPKAIPEKCTHCKICIKSCPVEAMTSNGKIPVIDYVKCINCDCCFEVCPENAIEQEFSWLAKKFK